MPRARPARPTGNHLLDRLPDSELSKLLVDAEVVSFAAREEVDGLRWDDQPVYFPTGGVYSLLLPMKDGHPVEVAVVDSEGMLGIPIVLGMNENPVRAVAQVAGDCIRVPADRFLAVLRGGGVLDALVRRFLAVSWQAANQTIACNLRHTVKERVCRWLLSVHDRSVADEFDITQEVLSGMVGASRPKVTVVVGELQAAGHIRCQRGRVGVLDRAGLEGTSCECYRVLRRAYDFLTS
ncbi:MAG: Crp/Fnr family transcriptional regulator [Gemmataceae bacterium]|nr:Crp/Fnr family transcriptional regulator [Gemmataceae bacterium]